MKVHLLRQVTSFDASGRQVILQPGEHDLPDPEAAHYRARGWCVEPPLKGARKAPEPAPTPELVKIPAAWRELHRLQRVRLASDVAGRNVTRASEADEILAEEVRRRKRQE